MSPLVNATIMSPSYLWYAHDKWNIGQSIFLGERIDTKSLVTPQVPFFKWTLFVAVTPTASSLSTDSVGGGGSLSHNENMSRVGLASPKFSSKKRFMP